MRNRRVVLASAAGVVALLAAFLIVWLTRGSDGVADAAADAHDGHHDLGVDVGVRQFDVLLAGGLDAALGQHDPDHHRGADDDEHSRWGAAGRDHGLRPGPLPHRRRGRPSPPRGTARSSGPST